MRVQDPGPVLRDGQHSAAGNRRIQATGRHAGSGAQDQRVQARVSVHIRLGDPGSAAAGQCLHHG